MPVLPRQVSIESSPGLMALTTRICPLGHMNPQCEDQLSPKSTARARPKSSRDKVRAHRERLRKQGLRPIQIWVPDVRSRRFKAEAHRQSLAIAKSSTERKIRPSSTRSRGGVTKNETGPSVDRWGRQGLCGQNLALSLSCKAMPSMRQSPSPYAGSPPTQRKRPWRAPSLSQTKPMDSRSHAA